MARTAVFQLADGSSFVAEVEDDAVELHRVMRGGGRSGGVAGEGGRLV